MGLLNKKNIGSIVLDDIYSNLKEAIKYFDDPVRPPIVQVSYMTKDSLNTTMLWTKMIVRDYDPANGVYTFRDSLEEITQIDNFYKFMIPKE